MAQPSVVESRELCAETVGKGPVFTPKQGHVEWNLQKEQLFRSKIHGAFPAIIHFSLLCSRKFQWTINLISIGERRDKVAAQVLESIRVVYMELLRFTKEDSVGNKILTNAKRMPIM